MIEALKRQIKINKVRLMKNPIILMNTDDYCLFKDDLEKTNDFTLNNTLVYKGIPIKTKDFIKHNQIIIYDDVTINWLGYEQ